MQILVTNDDGVDAPALPLLADALRALGDVHVVAPARNQSWIAKAITRERDVTVETVERGGVAMFAVHGTPADCVQLAVSGLVPTVDVVVSGINLGRNHGQAFVLSSGTVGAAMEGGIAGIPSLAVSTGERVGDDYGAWRTWAQYDDQARAGWAGLAGLAATITGDLLDTTVFDHADAVSLQLPWDATAASPRRVDRLAPMRYGALFRQVEDGRWRHDRAPLTALGDLAGTDQESVTSDVVSIAPLLLPAAAVLPDDVREAIDRS